MSDQNRGLRTEVEDLLATIRAYVTQETIGPLKGCLLYTSDAADE